MQDSDNISVYDSTPFYAPVQLSRSMMLDVHLIWPLEDVCEDICARSNGH